MCCAQLAAQLLGCMRHLRHLHLTISYVPALPQLEHLLHLELRAIKFESVQARTPVGNVLCANCICLPMLGEGNRLAAHAGRSMVFSSEVGLPIWTGHPRCT